MFSNNVKTTEGVVTIFNTIEDVDNAIEELISNEMLSENTLKVEEELKSDVNILSERGYELNQIENIDVVDDQIVYNMKLTDDINFDLKKDEK